MQKFNRLRISIESATIYSTSFLVFFLSVLFAPMYTGGDQVAYTSAYSAIAGSDFIAGFVIYKSIIATVEPMHYTVAWLFSSVMAVDKIIAMSVLNGILAILFLKVVVRLGGALSIGCFLILTNFYFLVMFFTAERLKIGFLFLLLVPLLQHKPKASYLFYLFSVLSHVQMLLLLIGREFERFTTAFTKFIKRLKFRVSQISYVVLIGFLALLFLLAFSDYLLWKVPQYMKGFSFLSILKTSLFLFLTLIYSRDRGGSILIFIPVLVASGLLGSDRVVIMAYSIFFYTAIQYKGGFNFGIALTSLYYGLKSIGFVFNVFNTGQGYS